MSPPLRTSEALDSLRAIPLFSSVSDEDLELLSGEDYLALKAATDVELRAIWLLTRRWAQYGNPEGRPRI